MFWRVYEESCFCGCVCFPSICCFAARAGSLPPEIDGFRGIKWGTDISKSPDFKKVGTDSSFGGIDLYERLNDSPFIGAAQLEKIVYGCWQGKFDHVSITFSGFNNFHNLLESSKERFGAPYKKNKYIDEYFWSNDLSFALIDYSDITKKGKMSFYSKAVMEEEKKYTKAKAREGAASGF